MYDGVAWLSDWSRNNIGLYSTQWNRIAVDLVLTAVDLSTDLIWFAYSPLLCFDQLKPNIQSNYSIQMNAPQSNWSGATLQLILP